MARRPAWFIEPVTCTLTGCTEPRHVSRSGRQYHRCRQHLFEQSGKWRLNNPDKARAYDHAHNKKYQQEHPRNRRVYNRAYYAANAPRLRANMREYSREWARANRDKKRAAANARRARELSAFVEYVDVAVVWERDKGTCGICYKPADPKLWHLDHIVPLFHGGTHEYANVQVSHPLCNFSKGTRMLGS